MPRKSSLDLLGSVGLFEGLSRKELSAIHRQSKEMEFAPGKTIVKEGTSGVAFHLIVKGKARVSIGNRKRGLLGPGDFFGELSLIDRHPRTATVVAETPVRTLALVSWDFMPLLERNPSIARKILVEMCARLRADRALLTH